MSAEIVTPAYALPVAAEDRGESRSTYLGTCKCGARISTERSRYAPLVMAVACPGCHARTNITKDGM